MTDYAFEDLSPGLILTFGPLTVGRDEIVAVVA